MTESAKLRCLTKLVVKHGAKVDDRDDYGTLLKRAGLSAKEAKRLLPAAIKRAKKEVGKAVKDKPKEPDKPGLWWNPTPVYKDNEAGMKLTTWETKDLQYQVYHAIDRFDNTVSFGASKRTPCKNEQGWMWDWIEKDGKMGGAYYPKKYKTLQEALDAVAHHFRASHPSRASLPDDGDVIIACAKKMGIDGTPAFKKVFATKAPVKPENYGHVKSYAENPVKACRAVFKELIGEHDWISEMNEETCNTDNWTDDDWHDWRKVFTLRYGKMPPKSEIKQHVWSLFEPPAKVEPKRDRLAERLAARKAAAKQPPKTEPSAKDRLAERLAQRKAK